MQSDLKIKKISNRLANKFLKENNKTSIRSVVSYGVYRNNKLMRVVSFKECSDSEKYCWELISDIRKKGFSSKGLTNNIWDTFIHDYPVHSCVSKIGKRASKEYFDCGFNEEYLSYFIGGIIYKITDLNTNKFYIGETIKIKEFNSGKYNGSGGEWSKYFNKYKDTHKFKREILKDDFKDPVEMHLAELEEIKKYCITLENGNFKIDKSTGCMNNKVTAQPKMPICPECGAVMFHHTKDCSQHKPSSICPECKGKHGHHKKKCSQYKPSRPCSECGGKNGHHEETCSKYKKKNKCPECGSMTTHKKWCSHHKDETVLICPECKGKRGHHKKKCSQYKAFTPCPECGHSPHLKSCSKAKEPVVCPECKSKYNNHKKSCSHYYKNRQEGEQICK